MARQGRDKEDGWSFLSKTNVNIHDEMQLDIYERKVEWSKVNQLRSVVETEFSCMEVFGHLLATFGKEAFTKEVRRRIPAAQAKMLHHSTSLNVHVFSNISEIGLTALFVRDVPFPWPLSQRYIFVVQDYIVVQDDNRSPWFLTYNHDAEHPYFQQRKGYIRCSVKLQGLVGVPIINPISDPASSSLSSKKKITKLTWLVNMDGGGLVPSSFFKGALVNLMYLPAATLSAMENGKVGAPESTSQQRVKAEIENSAADRFVRLMPVLDLQHCLVEEFKTQSMQAQRLFFIEKMMEMAREGHDQKDGWVYKQMTNAKGVSQEHQLLVHERSVGWSSVKQLRSVVRTSISVEEVFEYLISSLGRVTTSRHADMFEGRASAAAVQTEDYNPFVQRHEHGITTILYKTFPFPWPFVPRYVFVVQDYCRREADDGKMYFVCYNHDAREYPYFSSRRGFHRANMRFQGMVGVSALTKGTRLTWLVNLDFGGLVPTLAVQVCSLYFAHISVLLCISLSPVISATQHTERAYRFYVLSETATSGFEGGTGSRFCR